MSYVGRLAPSPTGAQHVGNARTFLIAWLHCRQAGGKLLLRVEDLDTPRTKHGATAEALEDLRWLGLDWDPVDTDRDYTTQSDREQRYQEALNELKSRELVYPCTCTRTDLVRSDSASEASAPHEPTLDGTVYPGTCASRLAHDAIELERQGKTFAWRFRMPPGLASFQDGIRGNEVLDAKTKLGDFVVARSYGVTAYQLAVVVDDHEFGINHVVRGDDLVYSTYRQQALYRVFGWAEPAWFHVPLVIGEDGRRLAKRHGDSRLSHYRKRGIQPETILGYLGKTLGLLDQGKSISSQQLLRISKTQPDWLAKMSRCQIVFESEFETK